jgi:hypothetical protein
MNKAYYDAVMAQYYRVLVNNWDTELGDAAKICIQMISEMAADEKFSEAKVRAVVKVIERHLGEDFAASMNSADKQFVGLVFNAGFREASAQARVSINWQFAETNTLEQISKQNMLWIGKHFNEDVKIGFQSVLSNAVQQGLTKAQVAEQLKQQFADLSKKGQGYWNGLAEQTMLRMRIFGKLSGYEKAGASGYKLLVIVDDRTSDICLALNAQDLTYPLSDAVELRDKIINFDNSDGNLEDARAYIKDLAPWVSDDQVVYDAQANPIGVQGAHTPFPPFHWHCRTDIMIV